MAAKDLYEKDFYKVLGVDKKASADEIKKKYRSLARDLHPDKNQGDSFTTSDVLKEMKNNLGRLIGYFIKLFFNICGEVVIHYILEVFHKEIRNHRANIRRKHFWFFSTCNFRPAAMHDFVYLDCQQPRHTIPARPILFKHVLPF